MPVYYWIDKESYAYREGEAIIPLDAPSLIMPTRSSAERLYLEMRANGMLKPPEVDKNIKNTKMTCPFCNYNFAENVKKKGENVALCPHCGASSTKFLHGTPRGWSFSGNKKKKKKSTGHLWFEMAAEPGRFVRFNEQDAGVQLEPGAVIPIERNIKNPEPELMQDTEEQPRDRALRGWCADNKGRSTAGLMAADIARLLALSLVNYDGVQNTWVVK